MKPETCNQLEACNESETLKGKLTTVYIQGRHDHELLGNDVLKIDIETDKNSPMLNRPRGFDIEANEGMKMPDVLVAAGIPESAWTKFINGVNEESKKQVPPVAHSILGALTEYIPFLCCFVMCYVKPIQKKYQRDLKELVEEFNSILEAQGLFAKFLTTWRPRLPSCLMPCGIDFKEEKSYLVIANTPESIEKLKKARFYQKIAECTAPGKAYDDCVACYANKTMDGCWACFCPCICAPSRNTI